MRSCKVYYKIHNDVTLPCDRSHQANEVLTEYTKGDYDINALLPKAQNVQNARMLVIQYSSSRTNGVYSQNPPDKFNDLVDKLIKENDCVKRGESFYKQGKYTEALYEYEQAIKLNDKNASYHTNKGNALKALSRFQESIIAFDDAIKIDAENSEALNGKAESEECINKLINEANSLDVKINTKLTIITENAYKVSSEDVQAIRSYDIDAYIKALKHIRDESVNLQTSFLIEQEEYNKITQTLQIFNKQNKESQVSNANQQVENIINIANQNIELVCCELIKQSNSLAELIKNNMSKMEDYISDAEDILSINLETITPIQVIAFQDQHLLDILPVILLTRYELNSNISKRNKIENILKSHNAHYEYEDFDTSYHDKIEETMKSLAEKHNEFKAEISLQEQMAHQDNDAEYLDAINEDNGYLCVDALGNYTEMNNY